MPTHAIACFQNSNVASQLTVWEPLQIPAHQCFYATHTLTLTPCLSCNQLFCLFFTPTLCLLSPTGGALVLVSMPCPLIHANSCSWGCCLCQAYLLFISCVSLGHSQDWHIQEKIPKPTPLLPPIQVQHSRSLCVWMGGKLSGLVTDCIRHWGEWARERVTGIQRECERGGMRHKRKRGRRLSVCGGEAGIREGRGS